MAEGKDTYNGLAVPLFGDFEIKQRTAATDVMTITGATSQSGDFIVCQIAAGTEVFVVDVSGNVTAAGTLAVTGATTLTGATTITGVATLTAKPVLNAAIPTTAPTTGLTTGEIFFYDAANVRRFAVALGAGTHAYVAMNAI